MLKIFIGESEQYNSQTGEFYTVKPQTITLEHSLLSVSKWESKWKKPFLGKEKKSYEELMDYVRCMVVTPNVDPRVFYSIGDENFQKISDYINDPMTATTFRDDPYKKKNREIITSELVYFWMTSYQIPFECQKWHLNRLLTLIEICSIKNTPPKKMSKGAIHRQNAALNAARKSRYHTSG